MKKKFKISVDFTFCIFLVFLCALLSSGTDV